MAKPWAIITGATGFLGGQLVRQLRKEYRIFAFGRRNPAQAGAPEGPGIRWFLVDIAHMDRLREAFVQIREEGHVDLLLHLAAYYDFTGEDHPEYTRTNVEGTRNLLELAETLDLRRFIYTSSAAACPFPAPGQAISEQTPATAPVPYAVSKRRCEELLQTYEQRVPSCIIRPAVVFTEWCEYEPLYVFLETWCSRAWNSRVLGGRGQSAVPYLHVEDLLSLYIRVVERCDELDPAEVLLASPDGCTTHLDLYRAATTARYGSMPRPIFMPAALARPGVRAREAIGRLTGHMPFERSWMIDYIDLQLNVDASRTRRRIDWAPNRSRGVLETLPKMVENMRTHPAEWKMWSERRQKKRLPMPVILGED